MYPTLKSYSSFNYVDKNNANALKVSMNISRKRVISASEMTYIVSGGALNSTHSLTYSS